MLLTKTQTLMEKSINFKDFAIFIVNKDKKKKILDLTINDWLKMELKDFYLFEIDAKNEIELKNKILLYLNNFKYFMIIYNNTPYITKNLLLSIIDYTNTKKIKACKLFSGAVFESSYYCTTKNIVYDNFYMQNQEQFFVVESEEDIKNAEKIFTKRIIKKHIANGVNIENSNSVIISSLVEIGRGTVILNNCIIKGKCKIGKNCIINNNTTIIDSILSDNVSVSNSIVEKSKIRENVIISPYCNIKKATIDKDCLVGYYCVIEDYKVLKNTNIKERSTLRN